MSDKVKDIKEAEFDALIAKGTVLIDFARCVPPRADAYPGKTGR